MSTTDKATAAADAGDPVADQGGGSQAVVGDPAAVRTVVVVFKTHLDLGFTDFAAAVERRYFEAFFPRALALAREHPFRWTTGSYILTRWLESLHGPALREAEAAVAAGGIAWHALPFTFHTELLSPGLLDAGLALSQRLDRRFGRTTITAKMTDVPGHTRGMIPCLARAGVLPGGNSRLHAVGEGVRWDGGLRLLTPDAPLVAVGTPELCPADDRPPDPAGGAHINLWNNWWNTNFPYWSEDDLRVRFELLAECPESIT